MNLSVQIRLRRDEGICQFRWSEETYSTTWEDWP